ncbi:hypothetical protein D3C75_726890 [compost metagenome]
MLGVFFSETLNVLHPKEVVPESRLRFSDSQRPRQRYQRGADDGQRPKQQHLFPAFLRNHPRQHAQHRHRQRQKTFGHDAHAASNTQQQVTAHLARRGLCIGRQPEAAHGRHQPQGDHRVENGVSPYPVNQQAGQENHT